MALELKLPYMLYTVAHLLLFYAQMKSANHDNSHFILALVSFPMLTVSIGCAIDNLRLSLGICAIGKALTYISFFFHLVALPALAITVTIFIQRTMNLPADHWVLYISGLVSVLVSLDGLHIYTSCVSGKLLVKPNPAGGLTQYGLVQTPPRFLMGVIVLSLSLLACGVVYWRYKSDPSVLILQLFCFVGQAASPALASKKWLMQVMNIFEVIVIGNMIWVKQELRL